MTKAATKTFSFVATQAPGTGRKYRWIAGLALVAIVLHLARRIMTGGSDPWANVPLWLALGLGGVPLLAELMAKLFRGEFGSDSLAAISIVSAVFLGEYLAGTLVVLMLAGGSALESFAVRKASSVLQALSRRLPAHAHQRQNGHLKDVPLDEISVGDTLVVFPHEACPVDGTVLEGHSVMDESYLTGEPYRISKTPGSDVLSGAINGESALTIRARRLAVDSRYARIMQVMQDTEQFRPRLRRLGDQLGAWYTPLAVTWALTAWAFSGHATRFLAVLVVATPCPLLIAIPVSILGAISLSARRGIIIKHPEALEQIGQCRTIIFDKTGTLTYGEPRLTERLVLEGFHDAEVLSLAASLERYSKHPLAASIHDAAQAVGLALHEASTIAEPPGQGLQGTVAGRSVEIISRKHLPAIAQGNEVISPLPPQAGGMECVVVIDRRPAALYRFRDEPRADGATFVHHLQPKHGIRRTLLVSGDRESEVRYLAEKVGIAEVYSSQSPEDKVAIVRRETALAPTVFLGDGINDAPALLAATVGIAFGKQNEVTSEAADAVVLDTSLERVDELLHIGARMRRIALESALGGMTLSVLGMALATVGMLPPVAGAVFQELIDVAAVLNALRAGWAPAELADFGPN